MAKGYGAQDMQELRQLFADDCSEWNPIRDEGDINMRYVAGDPWDPKARQIREKSGRPVITADELSQYTNQVVNEVRSNKRAVKFAPVGNGANDETAQFYADKMREIEYRSRAQIAYTTAFENAVQRSYGFCRVSTRYESSRSVNQDIWIDAIHNPNLVTPDPYAVMPDLSDMKHCWVREPWQIEDFNRRFPKAKIEGRPHAALMADVPTWVGNRIVWVAEHWKVRMKRRTLLIIQPDAASPRPGSVLGLQNEPTPEPVAVFDDEPNRPRGKVLRERPVDDPSIYQCLTNGVEILEETPWPGKYIPIIGCLGKVIYLDEGEGAKRKILSMITLARDPYMMYCYYWACEQELVGMTPKFPYFARRGSLKPDQLLALQKSLHEPVAVIEVETRVDGMGEAPPEFPMRQPYEPPIQALEIGKESARRAIQAAMGQSPLPTQAQRRNEKSGVALKRIEEAGQRGSFHFTDHYLDMITHVGIVIEDLMDKIYDTARDVGIRKPNEDAETVRINDPSAQKPISTKGDHLVTVSTGPSFESERDAASDFADTLAQIGPEIFATLGPLIVKLKNLGPIGDEMIELLEALQPPPVQQMREAKKQQAGMTDPKQMITELQAAKSQLQQMQAVMAQMKQALDTDAAKQQATVEKAKLDNEIRLQIAEMDNAARIRIAEIAAAVKGYELEAEHALSHEELALGHAHQSFEADQARAHEADMADRQHEQALEQGRQGVEGEMATQAQAAALQPPPEEGASA